MVLYAADPGTVISPPVVIALGSVGFFLSTLDVLIDIMVDFTIAREPRLAAPEMGNEGHDVGMPFSLSPLIVGTES